MKYGGICVRKSENCPQEDMKRTKIEKIIMPISFNDNECLNGDDYAVVELAERVKVGSIGFRQYIFDSKLLLVFERNASNLLAVL